MPSGSRFALIALLSLLVVGVAPPGTAASTGDVYPGPATPGTTVVELEQPAAAEPAQTDRQLYGTNSRIVVDLQPDGDARFRLSYAVNLTDEVDRTAFEEIGREFESGGVTDLGFSSFQRGRSEASRTINRSMEIPDENVERSWSISSADTGNATGRLTLSFTWTNFAQTADGNSRLAVRDAFETPAGTWLSRLEPGQEFVIRPPEGYGPVTGSGDLREESFYWEGPQTFTAENHPSAVFSSDGLPMTALLAVLFGGVVSILGIGYLVVRRRSPRGDGGEAPSAAAEAAETDDPAAEEPADGDVDGGAGAGGAAAATDDAAEDDVDVELLSDEERVERLLDRNGGRMKQASIVKETGWSNAKVSQLLSSMEEEGRIDKLRIGRENLISFPDEDVADVEE